MIRKKELYGKVFFVVAICFFSVSTFVLAGPEPRVINGTNGFTATYPWIASLTITSADFSDASGCGGSLIAPGWVLTAAHCFLDEAGEAVDMTAAQRTEIVFKSDTESPPALDSISVKAKQVLIHPDYDPNQLTSLNANDNDIALVELASPVNLPVVPLMGSASPDLPDGTETIIMGWGATAVDENNTAVDPSNTLLQAQQQIFSQSDCALIYGGDITSNMICAGAIQANDTTDTCQGDSGGPMVVNTPNGFVQVGIVSFGGTENGPACGDPNAPGVYVRLSQYESFVTQYVDSPAFKDVVPLQFNCSNSLIDSALNLTVPCLNIGGTTFSASFPMTDPVQLLWQWNGLLGTSACNASDSQCAVVDNNLSIILPGIDLGGSAYTLTLEYDGEASKDGKHLWKYQSHLAD